MKRADALDRWRRIASGDLRRAQYDPVDLIAWIEGVAKDVLQADDGADSKQRPYDLTCAVGLAGTSDRYPELRHVLQAWNCFDYLDEEGNPTAPKRGKKREQLISVARQVYPKWNQLSDEEVHKRASSLLK